MRDFEDRTLLLLVAGISLLFGWILLPFAGAILWAVVLAILFAPLNQRLLALMPQRHNTAALVSVAIIATAVILPVVLVALLLVQEIGDIYGASKSGEVGIGGILQHMHNALPPWARISQTDLKIPGLKELSEQFSTLMAETGRFLATQAINFGQNTIRLLISCFVMLYLLFFLLRDGRAIMHRVASAIPLRAAYRSELARHFVLTIRAVVKGSLVVAVVQGALGGVIFWLLGIRAPLVWGLGMAALSLLPVVGTGMIWIPVAAYLIFSGSVWQGIVLLVYGALVIQMADNLLRPVLVGKGAQIPDYVVLVTMLGGIAAFGVNGFVIGPIIAALFLASWDIFAAWRADT